ncbi:MAG: hypothetical protein EPO06_00900 [Burkholderiaceae bacterium]|nr:MAG: hypothetical protein EPO06_00900 [Burkholderiaceae bacterium]
MLHIAHYPQLRLIAWNRRPDDLIDEPEALALYEANWRFIEEETLTRDERDLIQRLKQQYGGGVLNN